MDKPNDLPLTVEDGAVVWDGNQIGEEAGLDIMLWLTDEDFENGEFTEAEKIDVLDHLDRIVDHLKLDGYNVMVQRD